MSSTRFGRKCSFFSVSCCLRNAKRKRKKRKSRHLGKVAKKRFFFASVSSPPKGEGHLLRDKRDSFAATLTLKVFPFCIHRLWLMTSFEWEGTDSQIRVQFFFFFRSLFSLYLFLPALLSLSFSFHTEKKVAYAHRAGRPSIRVCGKSADCSADTKRSWSQS